MKHNMSIINYEHKKEKLNTKEELQIYYGSKKEKEHMLNITHTDTKNPIFEKIIQMER